MSYKSQLLVLSPSAYWPLDQSTTPAEVIGGLTTALENGAVLGAAGPLTVDPSTCATFDGTDDRINISDHATVDLTTNWSVSFFFNGDGFAHAGGGSFPRILSKGSGSGTGYQFLVDNAAGPKLAIQTQGLSDTTHQTVSNVSAATWYHVVTTYDGSNVRIYLNGALDYTGPATGSVTTNATALYMGQRGDAANRWDGRIAHLAIWNGTVLTAAQVSNLYAARTEPAESALALPYLHARVGVARVGALRLGDAYPNMVVTINGVDRTTTVQRTSMRLTLERTTAPSTAQFTIVSRSGFVPTVGQTVTIGYGGAVAPLFGGQITELEHRFEHDRQVTPWIEVSCTDYRTTKLDRRLITADFSFLTVPDAVSVIISGYTPGLNASRVKPGTGWLGPFTCENEAPSSALQRIAEFVGGGWRADSLGYVYLWDANGEDMQFVPCAPQSLIPARWSLRSFTHRYDWTQIRSRVIAEGYQTPLVVTFPSDVNFALTVTLPVETASVGWFNTSAHADANYIRIGTSIFSYDSLIDDSIDPFTDLPRSAVVGVAVAPGDTTVTLASAGTLGGSGWVHDGDGHYFYFGAPGGGFSLATIPASGYGSITTPLAVDTVLYQAPILSDLTIIDGYPTTILAGTSIVVRAQVDDAVAQAALVVAEGGDGIHEFFVSDDDATWNGCLVLAQGYLTKFSEALTQASWTTVDRNALPNADQTITITLTGGLSVTMPIDRVTITFPEEAGNPFPLPLRDCEGGDVSLEGIIEFLQARVA